jgi:hypothetical protein
MGNHGFFPQSRKLNAVLSNNCHFNWAPTFSEARRRSVSPRQNPLRPLPYVPDQIHRFLFLGSTAQCPALPRRFAHRPAAADHPCADDRDHTGVPSFILGSPDAIENGSRQIPFTLSIVLKNVWSLYRSAENTLCCVVVNERNE